MTRFLDRERIEPLHPCKITSSRRQAVIIGIGLLQAMELACQMTLAHTGDCEPRSGIDLPQGSDAARQAYARRSDQDHPVARPGV
jgi:hypothetical protein